MAGKSKEILGIWSHARIYAIGSVINRAAGIVLIPLYAHLLPASEFGLYTIVVVTADMAAVLIGGVVGTAMVRIYLESEDRERRAMVAATAFASFAVLGFLAAAAAHPMAGLASRWLFNSNDHRELLEFAVYSSILSLLFNLELDYFRAEKRPWVYLFLSSAKSIIMFASSFVLVAYYHLGVMGIVLATAGTFLVVASATLASVLRQTGLHFDRTSARAMLTLGLPMLPARMADLSTEFTDKYFINTLVSAAAVGHYSLAQRLVSLLQSFIASPFAQVWIVRRLETLGDDAEQDVFARIFTVFLAVMAGAGLLLATYAPEITAIISSAQYQPAANLVPLLALSMAIMPIDMNFQLGIIHAKKTVLLLHASLVAALVNVLFMYILVRGYAALGATVALLLTNIVRVVLVAWFSLRFCDSKLRFEWGRTALLLSAAVTCYLAARGLFGLAIALPTSVAKLPVLAVYGIAVWVGLRPTRDSRL